jgi:membrane-bound serine protease (ClpP class)
MLVRILRCWLFALLSAVVASAATKLRPAEAAPKGEESPAVAQVRTPPKPGHKVVVYVVPIKGEIATPVLYILRRGLKEAIERKADVVVLDMKTPGGALDVTFDIMEALAKFPGTTITFVNDEAMSAGSFISATTDEIWFAPLGKIGAAAPVTSSGQDVDKTMKMKIVSYLKAEVRAISAGKGRYRAEVISAMIDDNYVLKIDGKVLKEKGVRQAAAAAARGRNRKKHRRPADPEIRFKRLPDRPARSHLVGTTRRLAQCDLARPDGIGRDLPDHRIQDAGLRIFRHLRRRADGARVPGKLCCGPFRT